MMNQVERLISELCPDGVVYKSLSELGDFFSGLKFNNVLSSKSDSKKLKGGTRLISYSHVFFNLEINRSIEEFAVVKRIENENELQYGDVLFTSTSETQDECGYSSVLTYKSETPLFLDWHCFGLRLYEINSFSPLFLKHLFRSSFFRSQISKSVNGVTRFYINKNRFARLIIPTPP